MSREIKFRVWDGARMYHNDIYITIEGNYSSYLPGCEVMQFTGLTDADGKEIYEGDVVARRVGGAKYGHHVVRFGRGFYDGGYLTFDGWIVDPDNKYDHTNALIGDEYRVIGNIYENPVLIDGK